jgi:microcin C transport system substrate-binding protein
MRLTPGVELKNYWSSEAAGTDGSFNLAGISDPVVDALIAKVMAARSREELHAATRAIDRVLRAGHYWVPHWYKAAHHLAFWNKYGRPAIKPRYERGVVHTWWYDAEKAAKLAAR